METKFLTKGPNSKILECVNLPDDLPPVRAYVHTAGFEVYDGNVDTAEKHLTDVLSYLGKHTEKLKGLDYMLAILWGKINDRMIDIIYCDNIGDWPKNKGMKSFVMKNNIYVCGDEATCGDGFILLGKEEVYRRTTKSLDDYMRNPPELTNSLSGF